jgi:hypothetical protein
MAAFDLAMKSEHKSVSLATLPASSRRASSAVLRRLKASVEMRSRSHSAGCAWMTQVSTSMKSNVPVNRV